MAWPQELQQTYRVGLIIRAENKKSLLAAISSTISSDDADIVELTAKTTADNVAELETVLEVRDRSITYGAGRYCQGQGFGGITPLFTGV